MPIPASEGKVRPAPPPERDDVFLRDTSFDLTRRLNKLLDQRDRGLGRVFLYKVTSVFELYDGCVRELGLELGDHEAWVACLVLHPSGQHDGFCLTAATVSGVPTSNSLARPVITSSGNSIAPLHSSRVAKGAL